MDNSYCRNISNIKFSQNAKYAVQKCIVIIFLKKKKLQLRVSLTFDREGAKCDPLTKRPGGLNACSSLYFPMYIRSYGLFGFVN